ICSRPRSQTLAGFPVHVARLPPAPLSIFQAEKVEVIDGNGSVGVFVNERESWARYFGSTTETCDEAFDELRLAAAESPGKRKHIPPLNFFRETSAEGFSFVRTIGNERSHRAIFDF